MCWTSNNSELKIAEEDIHVFKILEDKEGNLYSPVMNFKYDLNVEYSQESLVLDISEYMLPYGIYSIKSGFHSYSNNCIIVKNHDNTHANGYYDIDVINPNNEYIGRYECKNPIIKAECIIPKGALYGLNESEEYVSDKIKINSIENVFVH